MRFGLAWAVSLAFLFLVFYIVGRGFKSGEQAAA